MRIQWHSERSPFEWICTDWWWTMSSGSALVEVIWEVSWSVGWNPLWVSVCWLNHQRAPIVNSTPPVGLGCAEGYSFLSRELDPQLEPSLFGLTRQLCWGSIPFKSYLHLSSIGNLNIQNLAVRIWPYSNFSSKNMALLMSYSYNSFFSFYATPFIVAYKDLGLTYIDL